MTIRFLTAVPLVAALMLTACGSQKPHADGEHTHGSHASGNRVDAATKGLHGGRLLTNGDLSIEVTLFERGVPPEYRLFAYSDGKQLTGDALASVAASVTLTRLDGEINRFDFAPNGDYLRGDGIVAEPHSFDVAVSADYQGMRGEWAYASHEGRVTISDDMAERSGITTATAGPGNIAETLTLYGRIAADPARVTQLRARFPGLIRIVTKSVGDSVTRGERLVTVEADDSLQRYTLTAPMDGVIVERLASAGEVAGDDALLTIADYSAVWAQLSVFPKQLDLVRVGQTVTVHGDAMQASGTIAYISPAGHNGPARHARVVLDNPEGRWSPGMAVRADVITSEADAPLVVQNSALQAFRDFTVVFAKVGETYEVRMLDLGRSDGHTTEVLGGLKSGTEYVAGNSYLIKADIEKSGASHDH